MRLVNIRGMRKEAIILSIFLELQYTKKTLGGIQTFAIYYIKSYTSLCWYAFLFCNMVKNTLFFSVFNAFTLYVIWMNKNISLTTPPTFYNWTQGVNHIISCCTTTTKKCITLTSIVSFEYKLSAYSYMYTFLNAKV